MIGPGDIADFCLIGLWLIFEVVMHFVFRNRDGNETLSSLIRRTEKGRPWFRGLVWLTVVGYLVPHLVFNWF